MIRSDTLLTVLRERGAVVEAVADQLVIDAPEEVLQDAALLAALRERKAELLALLSAGALDLAAAVERVGGFMQSVDAGLTNAWSDEQWTRERDVMLPLLTQVEAELTRRGETLETYGWRLDERCRWQRVGEEPARSGAGESNVCETCGTRGDLHLVGGHYFCRNKGDCTYRKMGRPT
jgi:hypothetical protein